MDAFLSWFIRNDATVHSSLIGITDFGSQGRGAIALSDIPEGTTLFILPRSLTLSLRTSTLPSLLGPALWKEHGLNERWTGLILCMMWEEARGPEGRWFEYLASLPEVFDTPMFWTEEELGELRGTAILDKIGKHDAEADYRTKVLPVIHSRPDIFRQEHLNRYYSLERFHVQGSRILSRSFDVKKWEEEDGENDAATQIDESPPEDSSTNHAMDVDADGSSAPAHGEDTGGDSDSDDEEDPSDVAMVPMADILNAGYGCENAKLFYEPDVLRMVSTKDVKAGEQIYNTYGDPPNSDLLRRYGHVDFLPFEDDEGKMGNPADVVEIRADLVVGVVKSECVREEKVEQWEMEERVEWWLDEGGDDVFILDRTPLPVLPPPLLSFLSLLLTPPPWRNKRIPKGRLDPQTLRVGIELMQTRLGEYGTTLEDDEKMLGEADDRMLCSGREEGGEGIQRRKLMALVVRVGEKRILYIILERLEKLLEQETTKSRSTNGQESKRKNEDSGGSKKRPRGR